VKTDWQQFVHVTERSLGTAEMQLLSLSGSGGGAGTSGAGSPKLSSSLVVSSLVGPSLRASHHLADITTATTASTDTAAAAADEAVEVEVFSSSDSDSDWDECSNTKQQPVGILLLGF